MDSIRKERRLLYAIGWVKDEFLEEMNQPAKRYPMKKLWLVAAVIAVMLILAGCVAVFLRLQDLSFGKQTYVEEFDRQGFYIGPSEKTKDLLTINGYVGSPHQLAVQEWLEFKESYDPNRELLTNERDIPEIPNALETVYSCYTLDMVEKLNEIVDKYDLKLLDEWVLIQQWQSEAVLKALGVDSLLKQDAPAEIPAVSGVIYQPFSFKFEYSMTMTGEDALWSESMIVSQHYDRKGYFHPLSYWALDLDRVQQWNYRTSEGYDLLLALDDMGRGYIFLEKEEAYLTFSLSTYFGETKYPTPEHYISKEGLEQAAECFDYSIVTPDIDFNQLQAELDAADAAYRATGPIRDLPNYPDFDACMRKEGPWRGPEGFDYTFYDVDIDGEAELLFGLDGKIVWGIDLENGETNYSVYGGDDICENGIIHSVYTYEFSTYKMHTFSNWPDFYLGLIRKNGVWHQSGDSVDYENVDALPVLTEEEVQAILNQYPPVALTWKPVMEYAFADGTTVADITVIPEPISPDQLPQEYQKIAKEQKYYTYYCIYDLDGDGIDELLLADEDQNIQTTYGLRKGKVRELMAEVGQNVHPCEGGIWEETLLMNTEGGVELEEHIFYHMRDGKREALDYAAWNKATASWVADRDYTPMDEETAKEILSKYKRIDLTLLPIHR